MSIYNESIAFHKKYKGKLAVKLNQPIKSRHDLSVQYTPGVAEPCRMIHKNPDAAYELTIKQNAVAVVSDGSAVLGLGNIGGLASLPVMEGKSALFKAYANIDAYPICLATQDPDEIISIVKNIAPGFGGINLEDISAPRCFYIEQALQDIGIPVFHDDQHGTAIVVMAALIHAAKLAEKDLNSLQVVINGAGAAGTAIAEMLLGIGYPKQFGAVKNVILCDTKGILSKKRSDIQMNPHKKRLVKMTNREGISGTLCDAMRGADVFIGVSGPNVATAEMVSGMNARAIVFAMSNPTPEIMPEEAIAGGAFIVGTGRSDMPNQINNVLVFPGIFRGALNARARQITPAMKLAAVSALVDYLKKPSPDNIIASVLDKAVAPQVARYVQKAAL